MSEEPKKEENPKDKAPEKKEYNLKDFHGYGPRCSHRLDKEEPKEPKKVRKCECGEVVPKRKPGEPKPKKCQKCGKDLPKKQHGFGRRCHKVKKFYNHLKYSQRANQQGYYHPHYSHYYSHHPYHPYSYHPPMHPMGPYAFPPHHGPHPYNQDFHDFRSSLVECNSPYCFLLYPKKYLPFNPDDLFQPPMEHRYPHHYGYHGYHQPYHYRHPFHPPTSRPEFYDEEEVPFDVPPRRPPFGVFEKSCEKK